MRDYVVFWVFDEEWAEEFSLGEPVKTLGYLEHIKSGSSHVVGGPEGGPFVILFENLGESDVDVSVHMKFMHNYAMFVFLGGIAVAIIGAIVGGVGLILKPKVFPEEKKKRPSEITDVRVQKWYRSLGR